MCVLHAEDEGQPESSILTIHLVWDRISLVIFYYLYQASNPRNLQGLLCLCFPSSTRAQGLHTLMLLQGLRIQTQALMLAEQALSPRATSRLCYHFLMHLQLLKYLYAVVLNTRFPNQQLSANLLKLITRQACWHTSLISTLCQPDLHSKTMSQNKTWKLTSLFHTHSIWERVVQTGQG